MQGCFDKVCKAAALHLQGYVIDTVTIFKLHYEYSILVVVSNAMIEKIRTFNFCTSQVFAILFYLIILLVLFVIIMILIPYYFF